MRALLRLCVLLLAGTGDRRTKRNGSRSRQHQGRGPATDPGVDRREACARTPRSAGPRFSRGIRRRTRSSSRTRPAPRHRSTSSRRLAWRRPPSVTASAGSRASFGPLSCDFFVYLTDAAGNEQSQLYRFDIAERKSTLLTDGKTRNSTPSWATRSNRLAFTSTRRNGTDWDLYVMDATDPVSSKLAGRVERPVDRRRLVPRRQGVAAGASRSA